MTSTCGQTFVWKGKINQIGLNFGQKLCGNIFHLLHILYKTMNLILILNLWLREFF